MQTQLTLTHADARRAVDTMLTEIERRGKAAVINGLAAPPLLLIIMLVSNNRKIMKDKVNGRLSNALGWITTLCMTIAAGALIWALATGQ